MAERNLTQVTLALEAGVSQATVCRALRGDIGRHSSARAKLFKYAGIDQPKVLSAEKAILDAFRDVWDGSSEHAWAIARIIEALAALRPGKDDSTRR